MAPRSPSDLTALRSSAPGFRFAMGAAVLALLFAPGRADAQAEAPPDLAEAATPEAATPEAGDTPDATTSPVVRAMLVEAVAEYEAAHYPEAQALFRRAHEISPSARALRGLGMASYEMREYVAALRALEGSLVSTERPLTETQRQHVEDLVTRARGFIATVRLEIEPAAAAVRIDGVPGEREPDGALLVDPGNHTIVIDHEGYQARTLEVHLDPGVSQVLTVELSAVVLAALPPPPPPSVDGLVWAGAAFGIASVLALATSAVTGAIALVDRDRLRADCAVYICPESSRGARDAARDLAVATDVAGSVAAALGGTSLLLLLVAALSPSSAPVEAQVGCSGDGCVGSLRGAF